MKNIYDLAFEEIESIVFQFGEKKFHAKQIWDGLYRHLYENWDQFSSISKELREKLKDGYSIGSLTETDILQTSEDLVLYF